MPIDVSPSEPVKDEAKEAVEDLVKEEAAVAVLSEVDKSEELPVSDEVEKLDHTKEEPVVKDVKPVGEC